jgi:hypothetical protein
MGNYKAAAPLRRYRSAWIETARIFGVPRSRRVYRFAPKVKQKTGTATEILPRPIWLPPHARTNRKVS